MNSNRQPAPRQMRSGDWAALGLVPGQVLRVCGMRRSGNHAMADWLLRNAPSGHSVFLNNCMPRKSPLRHFRSIAIDGRQVAAKPALEDLAAHAAAAGDGAVLLVSYEDTSVAEMGEGKPLSGRFDETLFDAELVFYRSFLNWSASLLKKLQANPGYSLSRRGAIVLRAIDTYTRMLGLVGAQDDLGLVAVCYDDWHRSDAYRAAVLERLGWRLRDNALGKVQAYGGGSSFQKQADTAAELATDQRAQQMSDDPEYRAILALAARDSALTERLAQVFPADAARLAAMGTDLPAGRGP